MPVLINDVIVYVWMCAFVFVCVPTSEYNLNFVEGVYVKHRLFRNCVVL